MHYRFSEFSRSAPRHCSDVCPAPECHVSRVTSAGRPLVNACLSLCARPHTAGVLRLLLQVGPVAVVLARFALAFERAPHIQCVCHLSAVICHLLWQPQRRNTGTCAFSEASRRLPTAALRIASTQAAMAATCAGERIWPRCPRARRAAAHCPHSRQHHRWPLTRKPVSLHATSCPKQQAKERALRSSPIVSESGQSLA